jgi:hypothetical protein
MAQLAYADLAPPESVQIRKATRRIAPWRTGKIRHKESFECFELEDEKASLEQLLFLRENLAGMRGTQTEQLHPE